MDERNSQKSLPAGNNGIDSGDESAVVYCGDALRVREGFAIALQLMGMLPAETGGQSDDSEDGG